MTTPCMNAPWIAAPDLYSLKNFLRRNWMFKEALLFTYELPRHPAFWFTPFSHHSQLDQLWLPAPDYATPVWLIGCHATSLVTTCFPPQLLTSSLTVPWDIASFLDQLYTFSPVHPQLLATLPQSLHRQAEDFNRVAIILSMCLCSRTYLDSTLFTIILDLHLYTSRLKKFYMWWRF